jgi:hypothetical protein
VGRSSRSTLSPPAEPPTCLQPVYAARRRRTVELVQRSVSLLLTEHQPVSLAAVAARSRGTDVDPSGGGVSESAILNNSDARAYYEAHRSWKAVRQPAARPRTAVLDASSASAPRVKLGRDANRTRQRYQRWERRALAERLVLVEQAFAEQERHLGQTTSQLFTWMLIAGHLLRIQSAAPQSSLMEANR